MYILDRSVATSILFTETGCMVKGEDLTDEETEEIGFLVFAEEVGDVTFTQFNIGMVMICNKIMYRVGFLNNSYTYNNMKQHRKNMLFSRN